MIFIVYFSFLAAAFCLWLAFIGAFKSVDFKKEELTFQKIAFFSFKGNYSSFLRSTIKTRRKCADVMDKVPIPFVGCFHDNPATTPRGQRRFDIGVIVDDCDDEQLKKLQDLGFVIKKLRGGEHCIAQLTLRSYLGSIINIIKAYKEYSTIDTDRIDKDGSVIEVYNIRDHTHTFVFPVDTPIFE